MTDPESPVCASCGNPLPVAGQKGSATDRWPHFPFCSHRCRLLDLNKWLTGEYVIPGPAVDVEDLEEE